MNLVCAKMEAEMEVELGEPAIAIKTATVLDAHRTHGITG